MLRAFDRASVTSQTLVTIIGGRRTGKTTLAVDIAKSRQVMAVVCETEADYGIWSRSMPGGTLVLSDCDADLNITRWYVVRDGHGTTPAAITTLQHAADAKRCGRYVFAFRQCSCWMLYCRTGAGTWMEYDSFQRAHDQATATPFTALVIDTSEGMLYHYKAVTET